MFLNPHCNNRIHNTGHYKRVARKTAWPPWCTSLTALKDHLLDPTGVPPTGLRLRVQKDVGGTKFEARILLEAEGSKNVSTLIKGLASASPMVKGAMKCRR